LAWSVTSPPSCAPFAPGPLRPFFATMGALTPARSAAVVLGCLPGDHPCGSCAARSPRFTPLAFPPFRLQPPAEAPTSPGHVTRRRVEPRPHPTTGSFPNGNSGLRHCTAGSPPHAGRIEFSFLPYWEASCGLVVHLLLLPTPSHDDAVAVGYRFTLNLERAFTSPAKCALGRTVRRLDAAFPQSDTDLRGGESQR
jgi:hypothetical protein